MARSMRRATTSSSSRPGSSAPMLDVEWLIGDGKPLDTTRYFVVVPSMFANGLVLVAVEHARAIRSRAASRRSPSRTMSARSIGCSTEKFDVTAHRARDRRLDGRVPGLSMGARLSRSRRADRAVLRGGARQPPLLRLPRRRQGGAAGRPGLRGRRLHARRRPPG